MAIISLLAELELVFSQRITQATGTATTVMEHGLGPPAQTAGGSVSTAAPPPQHVGQ